MPVRQIVEYPDQRLRTPSLAVTHFDDSLAALITDLLDTLYATPGIGLCAPQLGEHRRVVVMDLSDDDSAPQVFINPRVVKKSGIGIADEACLSLPGIVGKVVRAANIHVVAQDRTGETFERAMSNMEAICLQHEIDHLDGKLLVDRLSWFARFRQRSKIQKMERAHAV